LRDSLDLVSSRSIEFEPFLQSHGWVRTANRGSSLESGDSRDDEWSRDIDFLGLPLRYVLRAVGGGVLELEEQEIPDFGGNDIYRFNNWAEAKASPQIGYTCGCEPRCPGVTRQKTVEEFERELGLL
jgi:hypothetical protein